MLVTVNVREFRHFVYVVSEFYSKYKVHNVISKILIDFSGQQISADIAIILISISFIIITNIVAVIIIIVTLLLRNIVIIITYINIVCV